MDIQDPRVTIQVPLSEAPWMEECEQVIHKVSPGREPFKFWMNSRPPTQPDFKLWLTYEVQKEWIEAVKSGTIIYVDKKLKETSRPVTWIHHIPWPYILNHNILWLRWLVENGRWDDVRQIDGIHNCVYSLQRAPRYGQLITVYSVFHRIYIDTK